MTINSSRRNFIRGAAGASLFAIGGCKCLFGQQKIKLAVVGVMGKGFTDWTLMFKSGLVEVVAFCDADASMREKAQQQLAVKGIDFDMYRVPFYTDVRGLLDDAGKLGVEAMTISTPDHMHGYIAVQAMRQGIHVYVQKPLVRTLWELDLFDKTARDNGVITQMGNQGSALNTMRRCTEVLQSGILGDVTEVHVWTNRPVWPQGFLAKESTLGGADPIKPGLNWDAWIGTAAMRNFKGEYKPGKKGYDPWNLCSGVYHSFSWRGFRDFGCGAFGDMACHTMNMPFRGLELGAFKSAECVKIIEKNDVAYPTNSIVKLIYGERASSCRPGVKLPECTVYWYDGFKPEPGPKGVRLSGLKPGKEVMPKVVSTFGDVPNTGCYIKGTKGEVVMMDDYGGKCAIAMKDEAKFTDVFKHEATKSVARVIPYRIDASAAVDKGGSGTGAPAVSADGHYVEFLQAIRGEGSYYEQVHSQCFADIEHSVPIMEGILVGCIAQQVEGRLDWCSATQSFKGNSAADALVKPFLRKGWEI